MFKNLVVLFAVFALVAAIAGTAVNPSYKVNLLRPSVVKGTELKAGEYRLNLGAEKVTIGNGDVSVEVPAKIETSDSKFETTSIRYSEQGGKSMIAEIRVGGTKTKVIFAQ